jgi:hypothetical protein
MRGSGAYGHAGQKLPGGSYDDPQRQRRPGAPSAGCSVAALAGRNAFNADVGMSFPLVGHVSTRAKGARTRRVRTTRGA